MGSRILKMDAVASVATATVNVRWLLLCCRHSIERLAQSVGEHVATLVGADLDDQMSMINPARLARDVGVDVADLLGRLLKHSSKLLT